MLDLLISVLALCITGTLVIIMPFVVIVVVLAILWWIGEFIYDVMF